MRSMPSRRSALHKSIVMLTWACVHGECTHITLANMQCQVAEATKAQSNADLTTAEVRSQVSDSVLCSFIVKSCSFWLAVCILTSILRLQTPSPESHIDPV